MKIPISLYIKAFQKIHVRDERLFTDFFFRFTSLVKTTSQNQEYANKHRHSCIGEKNIPKCLEVSEIIRKFAS